MPTEIVEFHIDEAEILGRIIEKLRSRKLQKGIKLITHIIYDRKQKIGSLGLISDADLQIVPRLKGFYFDDAGKPGTFFAPEEINDYAKAFRKQALRVVSLIDNSVAS